jgi:lipoprotein-anchoring transpeptidase ErfK/SrfK
MAAAVAVLLLALVAGCTGGSGTGSGPLGSPGGGSGSASPTAAPKPPAIVAFSPRDGSADNSVVKPVVVTAKAGKLTSVAVRNADGKQLRGTLSPDRTTWTSAEPLGYDKTYSVSAAAANGDGMTTKATGSFSTLRPRTYTMPYLFPGNGRPTTVGVGQPITVRFDEPIADKAAVERALTVTTTPKVTGGWYWFSDQLVHWRPKTYWKPGTKVTVKASVYGVHVGDDIYGQQDVRSSFSIGPSRIFTIDDRTHSGVVRINGKVVRSIKVSMGRGGKTVVNGRSIFFTTQSGPHIVAEKYPIKQMTSESYGLPKDSPLGYDEKIPLAVRISPDGEFVHAASWSVGDQGVRNVSHGCVNISPSNAQWFYRTFSYGDVVVIKNTGVDLPFAPGYNEWDVPWSTWLKGSALR